MEYLRNGGFGVLFPFTAELFSNDLGSKSLSCSNSFNRSPSNFVPTAGVFSNCLGGTGGAKNNRCTTAHEINSNTPFPLVFSEVKSTNLCEFPLTCIEFDLIDRSLLELSAVEGGTSRMFLMSFRLK